MQEIPSSLKLRVNERVLAFLQDKSAHDDCAGALVVAVKPLGDVQTFCPDATAYRYVLLCLGGGLSLLLKWSR